ncbi:MAG TPA: hypothetical protein VNE21_03140 [Mycobacteriales bacterium]|nr:hypothetical protein [Mycobacteriales bacterium]
MGALNKIGSGYTSASTVDGRMALRDGGRLGPAAGRLFAFVNKRFVYTSGVLAL